MKQIFTDKHIGCPVLISYVSNFSNKKTFYCGDIMPEGLGSIKLDIAFIFRMLDAAGYNWVQWVTYDKINKWCMHGENEPFFYDGPFKQWNSYGDKKLFDYFPSPLPWQESKFKRPEKIENESEVE